MNRFLLDSHIVAWIALTPERIGRLTRDTLADQTSRLFVSSVTIAELSIKVSLGKLKLPGTPVELCALKLA